MMSIIEKIKNAYLKITDDDYRKASRRLEKENQDEALKNDFIRKMNKYVNKAPRHEQGKFVDGFDGVLHYVSACHLVGDDQEPAGYLITHDFELSKRDALTSICLAVVNQEGKPKLSAALWNDEEGLVFAINNHSHGLITDTLFESSTLNSDIPVKIDDNSGETPLFQGALLRGFSPELAVYYALEDYSEFDGFKKYFEQYLLSKQDYKDLKQLGIDIKRPKQATRFSYPEDWKKFAVSVDLDPTCSQRRQEAAQRHEVLAATLFDLFESHPDKQCVCGRILLDKQDNILGITDESEGKPTLIFPAGGRSDAAKRSTDQTHGR